MTDFSLLDYCAPIETARPRNEGALLDELQRRAASTHVASIRGGGCSTNGFSVGQAAQIDMGAFNTIALRGERMIVGGGVSIGNLNEFFRAQDLWLPVLPSSPTATVGGALASGGFGPASIRWGGIWAFVEKIKVATCNEGIVVCGPSDDALGAFRHSIGGLGTVGPIVEAKFVLNNKPKTQKTLHRKFQIDSFQEMMDGFLSGDCDGLILSSVDLLTWRSETVYFDRPELPDDAINLDDIHTYIHDRERLFQARENSFVSAQSINDSFARVWLDFFVPLDDADALWHCFRSEFADVNALMAYNATTMFAEPRQKTAMFPLLPIRPDRPYVSLGAYATVSKQHLPAYLEKTDRIREKVISLNGRQYLHGIHPRTMEFYARNYGNQTITDLSAVCDRLGSRRVVKGIL